MNIVVKVILGLVGIAGTVLVVMLVMTISVAFAIVVGLGLGLIMLSAVTTSILGGRQQEGDAQAGPRGNLGNSAGRGNPGSKSGGAGRASASAGKANMRGRGGPNPNTAPEIQAKTIKKDQPNKQ